MRHRADYAGPAIVGEDLMRFDMINRIVKSGQTVFALWSGDDADHFR